MLQKQERKKKTTKKFIGAASVWHKSLVLHIESTLGTAAPFKPQNCLQFLNDVVTAPDLAVPSACHSAGLHKHIPIYLYS